MLLLLRRTKSADEECRASTILQEMCAAVPIQSTANPSGGEVVDSGDENDLLCKRNQVHRLLLPVK